MLPLMRVGTVIKLTWISQVHLTASSWIMRAMFMLDGKLTQPSLLTTEAAHGS